MPLTAVTGLPGHGKTLYTLSRMLKEFKGHRIVTYGIPDIDHQLLGTEPLDDPELWFDEPAGTVVVIDEAQKIFPVRGQGKPIPQKCSEFETHRHGGLDVVLITQDGTILDAHVRKFIDHHFHVYRLFGTESATVYEYSTFQPKPLAKSSQKGALSVSTWSYPKKMYGAYKSADAHTIKRKIPRKLIVVLAMMLAAIGVLGWAGYYFASGQFMADEPQPVAASSSASAAQGASTSSSVGTEKRSTVVYSAAEYARQMTPVIPGIPHSAPFYQATFQAADFPRPNCIIVGDLETSVDCRCYTQQMTSYDTTYEMCRFYATEGFFDPTQPRAEQSAGKREPASGPSAAPAPGVLVAAEEPQRRKPRGIPQPPEDLSVEVYPAAHKVVRKQPYIGYGDSQ